MNNIEIIDTASKVPDLSFPDKLRAQLRTIRNWEKLSGFDKESYTENFMDAIGLLYLDYFQFHLTEAEKIGEEFAQDIAWAE